MPEIDLINFVTVETTVPPNPDLGQYPGIDQLTEPVLVYIQLIQDLIPVQQRPLYSGSHMRFLLEPSCRRCGIFASNLRMQGVV